jgi:hypothetical protein
MPDDDLESIADANLPNNAEGRDRRGHKRGSLMPWYKGPHGKLRRIFSSEKGRITRKRNKAITQRPAHD